MTNRTMMAVVVTALALMVFGVTGVYAASVARDPAPPIHAEPGNANSNLATTMTVPAEDQTCYRTLKYTVTDIDKFTPTGPDAPPKPPFPPYGTPGDHTDYVRPCGFYVDNPGPWISGSMFSVPGYFDAVNETLVSLCFHNQTDDTQTVSVRMTWEDQGLGAQGVQQQSGTALDGPVEYFKQIDVEAMP